MTAPSRQLVSFTRFVQLMNKELRLVPNHDHTMQFIDVGTGYDFIAPTLGTTANQSLDKTIFERVSLRYTITR